MRCVEEENNAEKYVYDYYVLMDNLIDFEDTPREPDLYDDEEPSSNDENYRYNDYPDEESDSDCSHSDSRYSDRSRFSDNDHWEDSDYCDRFHSLAIRSSPDFDSD